MKKIEEKSPEALDLLDENHAHIWSRSKFLEQCNVNYINNLSECFNSWVSKTKDMHVTPPSQNVAGLFSRSYRGILVETRIHKYTHRSQIKYSKN
jgi:hypothetical protein